MHKPKPKFAKSIPPEPRPGIAGLSSVKDSLIPLVCGIEFQFTWYISNSIPYLKAEEKSSLLFLYLTLDW